jgi:arabinogalactan endo-1,4-beta-galactosidase
MKNVLTLFTILLTTFFLGSCSEDDSKTPIEPVVEDNFIRAADMSYLPLIESENTVYYNADNQPEIALTTLKNAGCNTIRIRLWKNPADAHSGFNEVKAFAQRVKQAGMKVWLTVHYSDTWADPGNQTTPVAWQNLSFADLKTAASDYTTTILTEIQPDIFQIGNEINSGLLWPKGHLINNESQCLELLSTIKFPNSFAITNHKNHVALCRNRFSGATWFYNKMTSVDYDYIGLSFYPVWHGKSLPGFKKHYKFVRANL